MGIVAETNTFLYGMLIPFGGLFLAAIGAIWAYEHNNRKSKPPIVRGRYSKPAKRKDRK